MKELLYSALADRLLLRPLFRLGYWRYRRSGRTPALGYSSFRKLHCTTRGMLNQELSRAISRAAPPIEIDNQTGVLGDRAAINRALGDLRRDGFHVFDNRLDASACQELVALATDVPATLVPATQPPRARFDGGAPRAPRYEFSETDLLGSRVVRSLLADPSIIALAQEYLGAQPINDLFTMWWSAPFGAASSEAAQLFHFDMDRIGFLKVFVYLTDVDSATGAHVYVRGSHRARPAKFFRDRRFTDAEIAADFSPGAICELTGPAGTVFAADTSGLHKGKALERGQRLVFQIEFANSLFGQYHQRHPWRDLDSDDPLSEAIRRYPHVMQRFETAE